MMCGYDCLMVLRPSLGLALLLHQGQPGFTRLQRSECYPALGFSVFVLRREGVVVPVPQVYDDPSLVIKVNPDGLFLCADGDIPMFSERIVESLNRIVDVWKGLKLGWVGNTSDEAEAFNRAWKTAMTRLFGSESDPESGIVNQIASAVATASGNYAQTEHIVTQMFLGISAALSAPGGQHDSGFRNDGAGPITEKTPQ
jgi:hypothetical protein